MLPHLLLEAEAMYTFTLSFKSFLMSCSIKLSIRYYTKYTHLLLEAEAYKMIYHCTIPTTSSPGVTRYPMNLPNP
jgi:hypothetical protein